MFQRRLVRLAIASPVLLVLSLSGAPGLASAGEAALAGRELADTLCSRCHAVGEAGDSPLAEAPRLRDLMRQYPPEDLEEAFAEGIVTGHADMPEFELEPEEIDALLDYLATLAR